MNEAECAKAMAAAVPDGKRLLEAHLQKWREWYEHHPVEPRHWKMNPGQDVQLMLHLFAGDVFTPCLLNCLKSGMNAAPCLRLLERMWLEGDEYVRNVLEVTILERLSDEEEPWQSMGRQVSPAFRDIVNRVIMPGNGMFAHVKPLKG